MLTYQNVIAQIKSSGYSYYRLRGRSDEFTATTVIIGDNLAEADPTIEQVLDRIDKHVTIYTQGNPNYLFELDLLKTPTSSSSGKHGPFLFKKTVTQQLGNPNPNQNELMGVGLGQIKEMMTFNNALIEPRIQLEREKSELFYQAKELERERKSFDEFKTKEEARLKLLEEKYNSRSEIAKDGASKAIWGILESFSGDKKGLEGAKGEVEEKIENTPEAKLVESIATNIYSHFENKQIDYEGIKKIGVVVQMELNKLIE